MKEHKGVNPISEVADLKAVMQEVRSGKITPEVANSYFAGANRITSWASLQVKALKLSGKQVDSSCLALISGN